VKVDIGDLFGATRCSEDRILKLSAEMQNMQEELQSLKTDCDRIEDISRRDNLRVFGIAESEAGQKKTCSACI
jgi:hypothetical protein